MTTTDDIINRWLGRMPDARKAYQHDPQYYAQINQIRRWLTTLDMLMEDERIPESTRSRILRALIYGAPDENEALARIERLDNRLGPGWPVPAR